MSPPPILFLDIDGVLNTPTSCTRHRSNELFLPAAAAALREIVCRADCNIVISSSWRMEDQRDRIAPAFEKNGLAELLPRIIGMTPDFSAIEGATREDEIDAWLADHQPGARFAILDDDAWQFAGALRPRLVLVNDNVGLTSENALRCIQHLHHK